MSADHAQPPPGENVAPRVYDKLRRLAGAYMRRERPGQTIQSTALVHEVYLRLAGAGTPWHNECHLVGIAARSMRQILVIPHTTTPVSERYASPLKLFEYMAIGRPIVASDVSSIREVLRDGENACLVRSADPESLASGVAKVLGDQQFAARIARSAFEEALSYTWARRAERLEAMFEDVVKRS